MSSSNGLRTRVRRAFCMAEDRQGAEIGLEIAVASIAAHTAGTDTAIFRPNPSPRFSNWLNQYGFVTLHQDPLPHANDWNCKPQALLRLLRSGYDEVIWLDSDIMVNGDCVSEVFEHLTPECMAVAQEPKSLPDQGTAIRTEGWGLRVGKSLPFTLNSSVVRVTAAHVPLLEEWESMLQDPRYTGWAAKMVDSRPPAFKGDQDVLNALIGSEIFAATPLYVLRSGVQIVHCGGALGYSAGERLRGLLARPPLFLHATAGKPWVLLNPAHYTPGFFGWYRRLLQECSPYVIVSRRYRRMLPEECPWMDRQTAAGWLSRTAFANHPYLSGLPMSLVAGLIRRAT